MHTTTNIETILKTTKFAGECAVCNKRLWLAAKMVAAGSCFFGVLYVLILQLSSPTSGKVIDSQTTSNSIPVTDPWKIRVSKAWEMLQTSPCKKLQYGENCTELKSRAKNQMNIYTAEKETTNKKLVTVLVEKVKGKFIKSDAVLVVDPYPDAHFGHTIIIFLFHFDKTKAACNSKGRYYRTGNS